MIEMFDLGNLLALVIDVVQHNLTVARFCFDLFGTELITRGKHPVPK